MLTIALLVVLAVLFFIDVIVFSYEKYEWSIGIMIASILGAYFFTPYLKDFITTTGWLTIFTRYVPVYVGAGLATALVKWMIFSVKHIGLIRAAKQGFDVRHPPAKEIDPSPVREEDEMNAAEHGLELVPNVDDAAIRRAAANRREAFVKYYKDSLSHDSNSRKHIYDVDFDKDDSIVDALTPRAKENVGVITVWVLQWPIVIVSTLFSDFLLKITRFTARVIDLMFSAVSRKLVARATKGL